MHVAQRVFHRRPGLVMKDRKRNDGGAGRKGRVNKVRGNCWEGEEGRVVQAEKCQAQWHLEN